MSRTKSIIQAIVEAQEDGLLPDPKSHSPQVYIMLCNDTPVAAYVDRATAEYEMHLCIQGDEQELGQHHDYKIIALNLTTHRL